MSTDANDALVAAPRDDSRTARRPRSRASRGGGGGRGASAFFSTVLVLIVVALAGIAWLRVEQNAQLADAQRILARSETRIGALEERLRLTDETLTEAGADTSEQLSFWESEIRKLWDMGNKRNRGWIEENRGGIARLASDIGTAQSGLEDLRRAVTALESSARQNQELADRLTELDMQMRRFIDNQRDLVDKTNIAAQKVADLEAGLERRVRENEDAIRAIDAHRSEVNSDIADIRRRLADLSAQLSSAPSTPPASVPESAL